MPGQRNQHVGNRIDDGRFGQGSGFSGSRKPVFDPGAREKCDHPVCQQIQKVTQRGGATAGGCDRHLPIEAWQYTRGADQAHQGDTDARPAAIPWLAVSQGYFHARKMRPRVRYKSHGGGRIRGACFAHQHP